MVFIMEEKEIMLELDAYELLRAAMLPGESLSDVVRRVTSKPTPGVTGADLLEYIHRGGGGVSEEVLDGIEAALNDKRLAANRP